MELAGENGLQIRIHGDPSLPALIYFPGLHGDWTLVASFRKRLAGQIRFVELIYPRTITWTLADYACEILKILHLHGIRSGWLLGESFGSQVVWAVMENLAESSEASQFTPLGVVLAGGFITHPRKWAVRLAGQILAKTPKELIKKSFWVYRIYGRIRYKHAPESLVAVSEFLARRNEMDRQAMLHRLRLIEHADFRRVASGTSVPVFYLTGFVDPIVPWISAGPQLKRYCPTLRARKMILKADHNVLGSGAQQSARLILAWMGAAPSHAAK
jgi:pimeloyl-ACP methyl ester carboxylesterase